MSVRERISALERTAAGNCPQCAGRPRFVVHWPGKPEPQPAPCPSCGADPTIIRVVYEKRAPEWMERR